MNSIKMWAPVLLLLFTQQALAQQTGGYCGTTERMEQYYREHPEARLRAEADEADFQRFIQNMPANKTAIRQKYIIPVVVHVVHNGGKEKISYEQVVSEFPVLNADYRRRPGTKGYGSGVDMEIEFSLATLDPDGNPTTGVLYVQSPITDLWKFNPDADGQMKALSRWPPEQYLNVYLVNRIDQPGVGGSSTLGYCFFPNTSAERDGAVIEHDSWGVVGIVKPTTAEGRVATHEFGHFLNLYHPFDGVTRGCGGKSCSTTGDLMCDTPPTNQMNFGNPGRQNTCKNDSPDLPDHPRNYMDYADDNVKDEFTFEQRRRAQAALNNPSFKQRIDLWNEDTHYMTGTGQYGPAKAEFWAERRVACSGAPIQFVDYSSNDPLSIKWRFPGGNPATSTDPNPVVTYSAPGTYDVILEVTNSLPGVEPSILERPGYVIITDEVIEAPFTESFENEFPPKGWQVLNPDSGWKATGVKFRQHTVTGAFNKSKKSVQINLFDYSSYGQMDALVTPLIDVSALEWPQLHFSYAYRPVHFENTSQRMVAPMEFNDSLRIYVSTDCGHSWNIVADTGGFGLSTSTGFNKEEPYIMDLNNPSEWQTMRIKLAKWRNESSIQLKFETLNGWGNNLYLDDIAVVEGPTAVEPLKALAIKLLVSPNPSAGVAEVRWMATRNETVAVELLDLQGRVLFARNVDCVAGVLSSLDLTTSASGLYVVRITGRNWMTSQRLLSVH